jgi:hypothetical protein
MITREKFMTALGFEPEQDDLERCNCEKAGQIGHSQCGWDESRNKPRFIPDERKAQVYTDIVIFGFPLGRK